MIPRALERPGAVKLTALPPLGLYVHIPWCVRKCPYCDFNSHERAGALPESEYLQALFRDVEATLPQVWGRRIASVFIGGGTPSLFSPEAIDALLSGLRARLTLEPGAEVTLEANPGTVEAGRFRGFRAAGVNRISIGVQSFDDVMLQALGRIHSSGEARRAIEAALASFDNVNIDLMYALPEHDVAADMQLAVEQLLADAGYGHYETSAFALPGKRCRHNLNYWEFGDYLGIGAGAHGKISFPDRITRHARPKQPAAYMKADAATEVKEIPPAEIAFEFMLNALRLVEGFPVALFAERTGLPMVTIDKELARAERDGLLERDWQRIRPTERGRLFLNELLERFLTTGK